MTPAPLHAAEAKCIEIGQLIAGALPEGWGFVMVLASHGDAGSMTYFSNIERTHVVAMLRELADKMNETEQEQLRQRAQQWADGGAT